MTQQVEDSHVVDEHALGEMGFGGGLHLDMEEEIQGFATLAPDFDELVGVASADGRIGGDLLEFFVEEGDGLAPVDPVGDRRKEEGDRIWKVLAQDLLPGRILVRTERGHCR